jgi:hypothetical protein
MSKTSTAARPQTAALVGYRSARRSSQHHLGRHAPDGHQAIAAERDREASSWTYCSGYEGAYLYLRSDICFVVGETLNIQWKAETELEIIHLTPQAHKCSGRADRPTLRLTISPAVIAAGLDVLDRAEGMPNLRSDLVSEVFAAMVRSHECVRLPSGVSEVWLDIEDVN